MLDLTKNDLKLVQTILKHYVPHHEVYAYGSRVTGKSHPGSDLELVIMGHGTNINELREAFRESDLPMLVDIFYWDEIPDTFKEEINNKKLKIFPG